MARRTIALALAFTAALAACTSGGGKKAASPGPGPSPTPISSPAVDVSAKRGKVASERLGEYRAKVLAKANYPGGIAVAPDGRIFYSELYGGKIRVLAPDGGREAEEWFDVNEHLDVSWEQFFHGGLTGITFDPEFESNHFVYAMAQTPDPKTGLPARSLLLRFTERDGTGTAPEVLLEIPAHKFDNAYSPAFGPDGMLYLPSGQNTNRKKGVDILDDLLGKVLRMTRDGKPPGDNPFGERAPLVWAIGIRNAFDIAFDPETGFIVAGENGTTDHDEINMIMPGHDYGWPRHRGIVEEEGITNPLYDYRKDRTAPVGIVRYDGEKFPELRGRFLMCQNHPDGIFALRVRTESPAELERMTRIADKCRVDIAAAPDGSIYFTDPTAIYQLEHA